MSDIVIRPLDLPEIETLIGWAKTEGWNPGLADAGPFHAADPDGFIGCFGDGVMAAAISAVRYGSDFGFVGLYIAHPDFRGKGYGRRVWDAGMAHLAGRTIGLDGVAEQQANYRSMGFVSAYETVRWSGRFSASCSNDIVPVAGELLPKIIEYDRQFFPAERSAFLAEWLRSPRAAFAVMNNGAIRGIAVMRQCHDGFKIGPLFAQTPVDVEKLMGACGRLAGDGPIHIDVPVAREAFSSLLESHGFTKAFVTSRMYRGPIPVVNTQAIFGITTLELG